MESFFFKDQKDLENWLSKNHNRQEGIWVRMYKKGSGVDAIKGSGLLDALLCCGWITGQAKKGNDKYALWWVCPRRRKSIWSKRNKEHAERLMKEGKMKPSGMKEIESAKKDGRWENAYPPQSEATTPEDFLKELNKNKKEKDLFGTLNRANVYSIIFRIGYAKTSKKRKEKIESIIKMLEKKEKFH